MQTAVLLLLCLKQYGCSLCCSQISRHRNLVNSCSRIGDQVTRWHLSLLRHLILKKTLLSVDLCWCTETSCLILTTFDVVWCWWGLLAVTALVMVSVCVMRTSLASRHPICSTHGPGISMHALITECTDPPIHRGLLVMWWATPIHVKVDTLLRWWVDAVVCRTAVLCAPMAVLVRKAVFIWHLLVVQHAKRRLKVLLVIVVLLSNGRDALKSATSCMCMVVCIMLVIFSYNLGLLRATGNPIWGLSARATWHFLKVSLPVMKPFKLF